MILKAKLVAIFDAAQGFANQAAFLIDPEAGGVGGVGGEEEEG